MVKQTINNKVRIRQIKESNLTILREPKSTLLGHIVVHEHNAAGVTQHLINFFTDKEIALGELIAICSDGEPTNTGTSGGIIRKFEEHLGRAVHWAICLLHFNELPLRHLYNHIEGSVAKGPHAATGPLAKNLDICHTLQVRIKHLSMRIFFFNM